MVLRSSLAHYTRHLSNIANAYTAKCGSFSSMRKAGFLLRCTVFCGIPLICSCFNEQVPGYEFALSQSTTAYFQEAILDRKVVVVRVGAGNEERREVGDWSIVIKRLKPVKIRSGDSKVVPVSQGDPAWVGFAYAESCNRASILEFCSLLLQYNPEIAKAILRIACESKGSLEYDAIMSHTDGSELERVLVENRELFLQRFDSTAKAKLLELLRQDAQENTLKGNNQSLGK